MNFFQFPILTFSFPFSFFIYYPSNPKTRRCDLSQTSPNHNNNQLSNASVKTTYTLLKRLRNFDSVIFHFWIFLDFSTLILIFDIFSISCKLSLWVFENDPFLFLFNLSNISFSYSLLDWSKLFYLLSKISHRSINFINFDIFFIVCCVFLTFIKSYHLFKKFNQEESHHKLLKVLNH